MRRQGGRRTILFLSELLERHCDIMYILRTIWWDLLQFVFSTFTLFLALRWRFQSWHNGRRPCSNALRSTACRDSNGRCEDGQLCVHNNDTSRYPTKYTHTALFNTSSTLFPPSTNCRDIPPLTPRPPVGSCCSATASSTSAI
jgi:hypothetical protein